MNRIACAALSLLVAACSGGTSETTAPANAAPANAGDTTPSNASDAKGNTTPPAAPAGYDVYGAGTTVTETVAVAEAIADPERHLGKSVRLSGPIVGTCAKKGCWMRLGSEESNVFVKFKDYGFFVPTSGVEGREAVVEGTLAVETQSVEDLKHYLEDAGKHEEAAKVTEPKKVLSFLATGVAIKKS